MIVAEGLFDKEFVAEHTVGLEDVAGPGRSRGAACALCSSASTGLERVAEETGVSANVILRVARECAAARRSVAVGPRRGRYCRGPSTAISPRRRSMPCSGASMRRAACSSPKKRRSLRGRRFPRTPVARRGRGRPRLDAAGTGDFPSLPSDPERLAEAILAG